MLVTWDPALNGCWLLLFIIVFNTLNYIFYLLYLLRFCQISMSVQNQQKPTVDVIIPVPIMRVALHAPVMMVIYSAKIKNHAKVSVSRLTRCVTRTFGSISIKPAWNYWCKYYQLCNLLWYDIHRLAKLNSFLPVEFYAVGFMDMLYWTFYVLGLLSDKLAWKASKVWLIELKTLARAIATWYKWVCNIL